MKPTPTTRQLLPTLALMLIATSLLTGCQRALVVRPAEPLPPPRVAVPAFLLACPPVPSFLTQTCTPAPVPQPTR